MVWDKLKLSRRAFSIVKNVYPEQNWASANHYLPKRLTTTQPQMVANNPPIPKKGANKLPRLKLCEIMVLTKIGSINILAGSLLCLRVLNYHLDPLQGILWLFPRAPYTT